MFRTVSYGGRQRVPSGKLYWITAISGTVEFLVYNTDDARVKGGKMTHHLAHVSQAVIYSTPPMLDPHKWNIHFSSRRHHKVNTKAAFATKGAAKRFVENAFAGYIL